MTLCQLRAPFLSCLVALGTSLLAFGCKDAQPCDPGQEAVGTACYPLPEAEGGEPATHPGGEQGGTASDVGGAGGASADAAGGAASEPGGNPDATFGTVCETDADCGGDAPICATDPLFYCTQIECQDGEENAGACPENWQCFKYLDNPSACVNF